MLDWVWVLFVYFALSVSESYLWKCLRQSTHGAGAAAVACVLLVGSDGSFWESFLYGERAAAEGEVENECEGRRLERERMALLEGLMGISLVAMMCETRPAPFRCVLEVCVCQLKQNRL